MVETALGALPLAVMIACAVAIERRRERRRRAALNRALHELRRPLQLLALMRSAAARTRDRVSASAWGQLDAALAALADLDAELNGRRSPATRRRLRADELVDGAVERWRWPATLLGRELELRWTAGRATVVGDPTALSRALDNLVANSSGKSCHQPVDLMVSSIAALSDGRSLLRGSFLSSTRRRAGLEVQGPA